MIRVLVNGAAGRMGTLVRRQLEADGRFALVGAADVSEKEGLPPVLPEVPADVVIDFSFHTAAPALADYCVAHKVALVAATTGLTPEESAALDRAAEQVPVFRAANFSLGVALLMRLARQAARAFPEADIEIVEAHHDRKADAPSGTALALAEAIRQERPAAEFVMGRSGHAPRQKNEIGIHALRLGNLSGTHEVIVATDFETITLRHEAHDRALFAKGALEAAAFLAGKPAGRYGMEDLADAE